MFSIELSIVLVIIALLGGIGITAIGPGGIFVTIALFALTPLSSAEVAGTASATFVATGLIGTLTYHRSGEFTSSFARDAAVVLSLTSIGGSILGTRLNLFVSEFAFGMVLAIFVGGIGALIVYRELVGIHPVTADGDSGENRLNDESMGQYFAVPRYQRRLRLSIVGTGVGVAGGMLGVGGPVIAVPLLVVLGSPMLIALAIAQVQSVFISLFAMLGYVAVGAVVWPVVILVGVPQVLGVLVGWQIAHVVRTSRLRVVLGSVLIVLAPSIIP